MTLEKFQFWFQLFLAISYNYTIIFTDFPFWVATGLVFFGIAICKVKIKKDN